MQDDSLLFAEDQPGNPAPTDPLLDKTWDILIIDDEEEVHKVTELVLRTVKFDHRKLRFFHAYSAEEAKAFMRENRTIALALVDVVMETDHAGLDLVEWIRKDLGNEKVRLVLRTGQPGQAPEQQVIEDYDINDYKDKTELTNIKLKTLIYATLRSYRDIVTIENSRNGLERVINATSTLYSNFSMRTFASAVLDQVNNLLNLEYDSIYASPIRAMAASHEADSETFEVIAATGDLAQMIDSDPEHQIPDEIRHGFEQALHDKKSQLINNRFFGYFVTHRGSEHLLYVSPAIKLSPLDLHLLEIYSTNVGIAYENIKLRDEIEATQRELVYILGEAVEKRSKETGGHVKRVAIISELLAREVGMSAEDSAIIKLASPLHDIGKIGIPDNILNKPGKLTPEEWAIMQTHATIGYEMLAGSEKRILKVGAKIAHEHHENWDGSGYPRGLKGEAISLAGRITAVADVFDALGSKRCYKEPWGTEQILAEMKQLSGTKFDPQLIDLLFDNIDTVVGFRTKYPD